MLTDGNKDKTLNSILFLSGTFYDLQCGMVLSLLAQGGTNTVLDKEVIKKGIYFLLEQRVHHIGEDFLHYCLDAKYKNSTDTYRRILLGDEESFGETLKFSPLTQVARMVATMQSYKNTFSCTIEYKYESEKKEIIDTLRKMENNNLSGISFIPFTDSIDPSKYARIVMPDIHDMDRLDDPTFKSIAVLNYGSNLQLIEDEIVIIPEYALKYSYTNRIEIIDSLKLAKGDN